MIPGNHEYYSGYDVSTALGRTNEKLASNITLINNDNIIINDINFIFSTMWSSIGKFKNAIELGVADFHRIKYENQPFRAVHFNRLHKYAFDFIKNEIQKEGKKVVVTHHLPSELCNAKEFKDSMINDAFCVDKTDFIDKSDINYWIYGHSHRNMDEIDINNTKIVTNQLGYVGYSEHLNFKWDSYFEI